MSAPLISVIIVCRNPGPQLPLALASVWEQPAEDVECLVVDGASTDGTREWLEMHRARLATLISEPDRGIYDAMNKGVAAARGQWVLFLGADDRLASHCVDGDLVAKLQTTNSSVVAGEIVYTDGRCYRMKIPVRPLPRNFLHHQGAFYRRSLFRDHGNFDGRLIIAADYEFNLRLWNRKVAFESLPRLIARCSPGGLSDSGRWQVYAEEIRIRHRFFPGWQCWSWDALSCVRFLRKQIVLLRRGKTAPA